MTIVEEISAWITNILSAPAIRHQASRKTEGYIGLPICTSGCIAVRIGHFRREVYIEKGDGRKRPLGIAALEDKIVQHAVVWDFRFHVLRHTFAFWYMMSGGDLYELSKLLGRSNIKMTERYADLARVHIEKTGNVSRELWSKLEPQSERGKSDVAQER